jgi:thymidylate synthase (FAD)
MTDTGKDVHAVAVLRPLDPAMSPEDLLVYTARVSNPSNQANFETGAKLLAYCIKNKHWSVFEQGALTISIKCSRVIAAQLLRHRGFTFQEFSQRYAVVPPEFRWSRPRRQGLKNRQVGGETLAPEIRTLVTGVFEKHERAAASDYKMLTEAFGVAREVARDLLPLSVETHLYVHGTVRQWIHYCAARMEEHAQEEHQQIAKECWAIVKEFFPETWAAVEDLSPSHTPTPSGSTPSPCPSTSTTSVSIPENS